MGKRTSAPGTHDHHGGRHERLGTGRAAVDNSAEARIGKRIRPQADGCWIWTGSMRNGYGEIMVNRRKVTAHRWVYETMVDVIPDGMVLHHACHRTMCVNPSHLVLLTQAQHLRTHAMERLMARGLLGR